MLHIPDELTFLTHKSRNFHFFTICDADSILPLLIEARTTYTVLTNIPFMPNIAAQLKPELIRRSIFGTAAIEGNPLEESDVDNIINDASVRETSQVNKSEQEIINLKVLYERLLEIKVLDPTLSEDQIKGIHSLITDKIDYGDNVPGNYRNIKVYVGNADHGGTYTPPVILKDIQELMVKYIEFINSDSMLKADPLLRAACAHFYLAMIHPFRDGNGRTARFVEAWLLNNSGYRLLAPLLSNYYYQNIDAYFSVFSETRKQKNMTPFFKFYLEACITSLKNFQSTMNIWLCRLIFSDYTSFLKKTHKISVRQEMLLDIMLDDIKPISLSFLYEEAKYRALYANVSQATARRDLRKLFDLGLLEKKEDNYRLNFGLLMDKQ